MVVCVHWLLFMYIKETFTNKIINLTWTYICRLLKPALSYHWALWFCCFNAASQIRHEAAKPRNTNSTQRLVIGTWANSNLRWQRLFLCLQVVNAYWQYITRGHQLQKSGQSTHFKLGGLWFERLYCQQSQVVNIYMLINSLPTSSIKKTHLRSMSVLVDSKHGSLFAKLRSPLQTLDAEHSINHSDCCPSIYIVSNTHMDEGIF